MAADPAFASPWTLPSPYWIVIAGEGAAGQPWQEAAAKAGLQPLADAPTIYAIQTPPDWVGEWERIVGVINSIGSHPEQLRAAIIAADVAPSAREIGFNLKPLHVVQEVVEHLWLVEHLSEDRLVCYLQRVVDRRGKQVGFEAFARIAKESGIIGGAAIMRASHALKVEYQVDRRMQKLAIDTYAACDLDGYIFINFLTGFIHRPEVYLEGLSQAVQRHHVMAKSVTLDVPLSDYVRDLAKLKSIAQYCQGRGFSLALDDVVSADGLAPLLAEIRPAFVKLDAKLAVAVSDTRRIGVVQEIIRIAHAAGALVLAEGIESQAIMDAYLAAGVDMFQGYHIGAPELYRPGDCP